MRSLAETGKLARGGAAGAAVDLWSWASGNDRTQPGARESQDYWLAGAASGASRDGYQY